MGYLPSEAEQEELVSDLAALISARGAAGFLTSPIVLPQPRFLPDPWHGDLASAQILLRRLMLYAGLDLAADLHVFDRDKGLYSEHAIAWYAGVENGRCQFGLDSKQLRDPQILIAALCHEIAHAYREHHGLCLDGDLAREEKLTDLTTVYLGFGILNANAADRFQKTSYLEGNLAITKMSLNQAGYLPAQSMSFLLALQLVARNLPPSRRRELARQLETNQGEYLARGVRHLEARRAEVLPRLGLPPDAGALEELGPERFTRPLDGSEEKVSVLSDPDIFVVKDHKPNADHTIFALRQGHGRDLLLVILGAMFGCWIGTLLALTWEALNPVVGACAGVLAAGALGLGKRHYVCTDVACHTRIPAEAAVCPGCGCRVGGRIRSKREIYANEE